jgi:ATP synthase protein I
MPHHDAGDDPALAKTVGHKLARHERARSEARQAVWFGLGMFGLVGWAVAVPTVLGVALGLWLDHHWASGRISWTLTMLLVGVLLGCGNAWYWVERESRKGPATQHR